MPVQRIHKTPSPFNASEVFALDYEQTADVIYFAHRGHVPAKLVRTGHYEWGFSSVTFAPTIAAPGNVSVTATTGNSVVTGDTYNPQPDSYVVTAVNEETGQESRASTSDSASNDLTLKKNYNTVTWDAVAGATLYRIYKAHNDGAYGYIGSSTALTFRDDNIGPDLSSGPPVGDNPFAGAGDYPGSVTFHEQRSIWGGSTNRPNGVWASRSADFENMDFTRPAVADDAFAIGLVSSKVNSVVQMVSHKEGLIAFTSNNIFSIRGANDDYLSASPPPRIRQELSRGSSGLNPIQIDGVIFYETAKRASVRTIGYRIEDDGLATDEVSIYSNHLFEGRRIVDWAYLEKPASIILAVLDNGTMACLTWEREHQVAGWTLWETDGTVESVCAVTEQGEDRAYMVVVREIGGEDVRFIERLASELWTAQEYACFLDCAKTVINPEPSVTVNRLEHLEGREVVALVDGSVVRGLVVEDGEVTLPHAGTVVTVGLPYTATVSTLPLAVQSGNGWTIARPQQSAKVIVRTVNSRGLIAGPNEAGLFPVKERESEAYGDPTSLTTGDYEIEMAGTSQRETVVTVKSEDPLPMHITSIMVEPDVRQDD